MSGEEEVAEVVISRVIACKSYLRLHGFCNYLFARATSSKLLSSVPYPQSPFVYADIGPRMRSCNEADAEGPSSVRRDIIRSKYF